MTELNKSSAKQELSAVEMEHIGGGCWCLFHAVGAALHAVAEGIASLFCCHRC